MQARESHRLIRLFVPPKIHSIPPAQFLDLPAHAETIAIVQAIIENQSIARAANVQMGKAALLEEHHPECHVTDSRRRRILPGADLGRITVAIEHEGTKLPDDLRPSKPRKCPGRRARHFIFAPLASRFPNIHQQEIVRIQKIKLREGEFFQEAEKVKPSFKTKAFALQFMRAQMLVKRNELLGLRRKFTKMDMRGSDGCQIIGGVAQQINRGIGIGLAGLPYCESQIGRCV